VYYFVTDGKSRTILQHDVIFEALSYNWQLTLVIAERANEEYGGRILTFHGYIENSVNISTLRSFEKQGIIESKEGEFNYTRCNIVAKAMFFRLTKNGEAIYLQLYTPPTLIECPISV
jgi:hypothetical protein